VDPAGLREDPEEAGVLEGLAVPEEDLPERAVPAAGLPARAGPAKGEAPAVPALPGPGATVLTVLSVLAARPVRERVRPVTTPGVRAGLPTTSNAPAGFSKGGSPSPRRLLQCRRWYQ
jgi:hypothetical protein